MSLAVIGLGLVSPVGLTPSDHAFFPRAGAVRPRATPFRDAAGEPVTVLFAPFLGARLALSERLLRLAQQAISTAMLPLGGAGLGRGAPLFVVTPAPRDGLTEAQIDRAVQAIAASVAASEVVRYAGSAGAFAALAEADSRVGQGRSEMALVVALDSMVDVATLSARALRPPCPWVKPPLPPGEGAAALLVTSQDRARARSWPALGTLLGAATAMGTSTNDDERLVDGTGMTAVLRALPASNTLGSAFGQSGVDELRLDEWHFALARSAARFAMDHEVTTVEDRTGEVGAAAGAMALAYGLATQVHGTAERKVARGAPFVAWSISSDGTRGAAIAAGSEP
ncbi:MAG: hypothetical protein U0441_01100 [Polyangiaceae bacterium]